MGTQHNKSNKENTAYHINILATSHNTTLHYNKFNSIMPVLIKKSITRSLSMKWNSVRGGKSNKIGADEASPSLNYEKPPEMELVSDTSSDDNSSSEDENDAAEIYGYGDASPDSDDVATKLPRRLSSRRNSVVSRRRGSIHRQQTLT